MSFVSINRRFRIAGLPDGKHLAAAVEHLEPGTERDPELLGRLLEGQRDRAGFFLDERDR